MKKKTMSELSCERKLSEEKSDLAPGPGTMKVSLKSGMVENRSVSVSRSPKFVVANGLFIFSTLK